MKKTANKDSFFMKEAIEESRKSITKKEGGPFGAVIVKDGKVISKAHNTVLKTNDPTMHAEVAAIRKASKKLSSYDLSGCILYSSCKPCPMCLAAARWANIEKIYYVLTSEDAESIGFRDRIFYEEADYKGLEMLETSRDEALAVFDTWREDKKKTIY